MSDIKQKGVTPKKLRAILISLLVIMIVAGMGGFGLFVNKMSIFAEEVAVDAAKAHTSNDDLKTLQNLEQKLKDDQIAINRTKKITATGDLYTYQTQIIDDISRYAMNASIQIEGYTFNETTKSGASAAASGATTSTAQPIAIPNVRTASISISIKSPVGYQNIITFLRSLELNLTKMQIQGISLTRSSENPNDVSVGPITVEVYIK